MISIEEKQTALEQKQLLTDTQLAVMREEQIETFRAHEEFLASLPKANKGETLDLRKAFNAVCERHARLEASQENRKANQNDYQQVKREVYYRFRREHGIDIVQRCNNRRERAKQDAEYKHEKRIPRINIVQELNMLQELYDIACGLYLSHVPGTPIQ